MHDDVDCLLIIENLNGVFQCRSLGAIVTRSQYYRYLSVVVDCLDSYVSLWRRLSNNGLSGEILCQPL